MANFGIEQGDRRVFGDEMRALRAQRSWSRDDLAAAMNYSVSTVKNIETGYRMPTAEQCVLLDKAFDLPGVFGRMRERLYQLSLSVSFRSFAPHEAEATTLRWFEHTLVPGLFQTEDYARVLLQSSPWGEPDGVAEVVDARLKRQAVLTRETPPRIWVVLDAQVLSRQVGGPEIMAEQLIKLVEISERPTVNIQVVPADRTHPGLGGAFIIAENRQSPPAVYLEGAADGQTVEDADVADKLAVLFDTVRADALTRDASRVLIEEAARQWKERVTP